MVETTNTENRIHLNIGHRLKLPAELRLQRILML